MWKSNHINLLKLWMHMSAQPSNKLLPSSVLKQHCKISHTVPKTCPTKCPASNPH